MDPALVILSARLFLLGRVANGDDVQRDIRRLYTQDFTYGLYPLLAGINSTPNRTQVCARQGVAKFLELTFSCIHTRI